MGKGFYRRFYGQHLTAVCPACLRVWRVPAVREEGWQPRCVCGTATPPNILGAKESVRRTKIGLEIVFAAKGADKVVRTYRKSRKGGAR